VEVDYLVSLQSIPIRKRRTVQLDVRLTGVVDLSDLSPLASFGMEGRDLLGAEVEASRRIGHAVS
jgi:hypothetical protein